MSRGVGGRLLVVSVDFSWWAALLARCSMVVSRDTGSVHLASALGRPVVAVYAPEGYQRNTGQFAPWQVAHRIVRGGPFEQAGPAVRQAVSALRAETDVTAYDLHRRRGEGTGAEARQPAVFRRLARLGGPHAHHLAAAWSCSPAPRSSRR